MSRVPTLVFGHHATLITDLHYTLINFELVQIVTRVGPSFRYVHGNIQSTLMQLLFLFDQGSAKV
jgi:hypothetical protein